MADFFKHRNGLGGGVFIGNTKGWGEFFLYFYKNLLQ